VKIVISAFTYPPNVDGVAAAAKQMVDNFRNAGHEVIVATGRGIGQTGHAHENGVEIRRFEIIGAPAFGDGFRGEIDFYQNFILSQDPDFFIVHCWDTWSCELALPLRRQIQSKFILVSHGYSAHLFDPRLLPRGLWKWLRWLPHVSTLPLRIRRFDRVVFLSNKSDWDRFFDVRMARLSRARNVSFIPNGVADLPVTRGGCFRQRYIIGNGIFFLCIANYTGRKNQERALRAFATAAIEEATLVFIGSELGDYGKRIIALWEQLKSAGAAGKVLFLQGLPRDKTLAALNDCDVKVLAADSETQPIVLLEAMAASKPFISTNTGCVEEFKGGIVVQDAGEMAKAMRRLATSPQERERLGSEGRQDYEAHYSLERTSKAWLKLLEELTAG
jgi:glycosyltransferase involved in cell wall biosynthesis